MKNILLNAPVYCSDRQCGQTTFILVNPQTRRVTHLIVKEASAAHIERLVPIEAVAKTTRDRIQLRCSPDEFKQMDPFVAIERHAETGPDYSGCPRLCQVAQWHDYEIRGTQIQSPRS